MNITCNIQKSTDLSEDIFQARHKAPWAIRRHIQNQPQGWIRHLEFNDYKAYHRIATTSQYKRSMLYINHKNNKRNRHKFQDTAWDITICCLASSKIPTAPSTSPLSIRATPIFVNNAAWLSHPAYPLASKAIFASSNHLPKLFQNPTQLFR